jgi:hypothetical protein
MRRAALCVNGLTGGWAGKRLSIVDLAIVDLLRDF